ncbi:unnamed protein product, partial [Mesorhabditis belari]|uniref:Uncharacterized protein n=1 Tax=Mesorhabditis belari TaxID=2138241 RepID=A0AAF3EF99_9BILA
MGYVPLILALTAVCALTIYLLGKYGSYKRQRVSVTVAVFIAWYFSLIIVFVLPLDVSMTLYNKCLTQKAFDNSTPTNGSLECEEPGGLVPNDTLLYMWRIVYWTAQVLCWLALPLMQSYVTAGEFTVGGRIKASLWSNAMYYIAYFIIFVIFIAYAAMKGLSLNRESLIVIIVSASNTWGLLLLVVLLGHGLVDLPRQLWHTAATEYRLNKTFFDIDKLSTDKHDAEDSLKDVYREARTVLNLLKNEHSLRGKAQTIVSRFPEEVIRELFPNRSGADFECMGEVDRVSATDERYLVRLHTKAIDAVHLYQRTAAHWRSTMDRALWLEEVRQAEQTGALNLPGGPSLIPDPLRKLWHTKARKPFTQVLSILLMAMTILILLSECTFFITSRTLSPSALIIQTAANGFHYKYTQLFSIVIVAYLCACAYFTIFRLKIYSYYHLDHHGNTDENSLLFSGMLLCRLTPPICLNFLGMIHLDSHVTQQKNFGVETQFTKLMGHLDLLPVVAKGINIYLPMAIIVFCALTYYKLGTRLLHAMGIDQYVADDHLSMDLVSAGRALVNLERNRRSRMENREARHSAFTQRVVANATDRLRSGMRREPEEDRRPIVQEEVFEYSNQQDLLIDDDTRSSRHPDSAHFFDDM